MESVLATLYKTLDQFIGKLVIELKNENIYRRDANKNELDIPYIIAPLSQLLVDDKCTEFIQDIKLHNYFINYFEDSTGGYTNGYIEINLHNDDHDNHFPQCDLYNYRIEFYKDQRYWGYCECMPNDDNYRADKHCCGINCDWDAPAFTLKKIINIGNESWMGTEHDYWDFEDTFYKHDKELADEKGKMDKQIKIQSLQDEIKNLQNQIDELMDKQKN
jgi:hypothetical protein